MFGLRARQRARLAAHLAVLTPEQREKVRDCMVITGKFQRFAVFGAVAMTALLTVHPAWPVVPAVALYLTVTLSLMILGVTWVMRRKSSSVSR